jgi:hypothetical protein
MRPQSANRPQRLVRGPLCSRPSLTVAIVAQGLRGDEPRANARKDGERIRLYSRPGDDLRGYLCR